MEDIVNIGKTILEQLDNTQYTGPQDMYDYWPDGGLQSVYYRLQNFISYHNLGKLSPYPIFVSGPHGKQDLRLNERFNFGHYNPQFLNWFNTQLVKILQNGSVIQNTKKKFEKYLGKTAMSYWATYKTLNQYPDELNSLLHDYKTKIDNGTLPERYYEQISYNGAAKKYKSLKALFNSYDINIINSAVYFWLRRNIDNTDQLFFAILENLLGAYEMIDQQETQTPT
jgi:hypothetical protein